MRCLNLTHREAKLFASPSPPTVLVRRVTHKTAGSLPINPETDREDASRLDWTRAWVDPSLLGSGTPGLKVPSVDGETTHRIWPPVFPGDVVALREGWGIVSWSSFMRGSTVPLSHVVYKATPFMVLKAAEDPIDITALMMGLWKPPQHMPARLARHRRRVSSVEVMRMREAPEEVWVRAGFDDSGYFPSSHAKAQWAAAHGPGSWERDWCWVIGLEVGS